MNSVLVLKTMISTTNVENVATFLKNEKSRTVAICNSNTLVRSYNDPTIQNKIKSYVKKNFLLDHVLFKEDKIFLRSQQTVIHYYTNSLIRLEFAKNIDKDNLDVIYGTNYSLYKLK